MLGSSTMLPTSRTCATLSCGAIMSFICQHMKGPEGWRGCACVDAYGQTLTTSNTKDRRAGQHPSNCLPAHRNDCLISKLNDSKLRRLSSNAATRLVPMEWFGCFSTRRLPKTVVFWWISSKMPTKRGLVCDTEELFA